MPDDDADDPVDDEPVNDERAADGDLAGADDQLLPPDERVRPGPTSTSGSGGSGWGGCALWALALLVVVIGGCAAGLAFRPHHGVGTSQKRAASGTGWRLMAYVDVDGSPCLDLDIPDGKLTGQSAYGSPAASDPSGPIHYAATSQRIGAEVITFGPVPASVTSVRIVMAGGRTIDAPVKETSKVHYFVHVGSTAYKGPATPLGPGGQPVTITTTTTTTSPP